MKVEWEATTSQGQNWQLLPKTLSSPSSKKYVIIKSWQQSFSSSLMKKILKKSKSESAHNMQFVLSFDNLPKNRVEQKTYLSTKVVAVWKVKFFQ